MSSNGPRLKMGEIASIAAKYSNDEHNRFTPIVLAMRNNEVLQYQALINELNIDEKARFCMYLTDNQMVNANPNARDEYLQDHPANYVPHASSKSSQGKKTAGVSPISSSNNHTGERKKKCIIS